MRKELTVKIDLEGQDKITPMQVIRKIRMLCWGILGCTLTGPRSIEITMSNEVERNRLMEGFKIGETRVVLSPLVSNEMTVSFLHLPNYLEDEDILEKLSSWGVTAVSPIKRRVWPRSKVCDGTRFRKVRFTEEITSLPYSTKFNTEAGMKYFRVIHDRQAKVCRLCLQPGHILREFPDFLSHKCKNQGHYARECREEMEKYPGCYNKQRECICTMSENDDTLEGLGPPVSPQRGKGEELQIRKRLGRKKPLKALSLDGPRLEYQSSHCKRNSA